MLLGDGVGGAFLSISSLRLNSSIVLRIGRGPRYLYVERYFRDPWWVKPRRFENKKLEFYYYFLRKAKRAYLDVI